MKHDMVVSLHRCFEDAVHVEGDLEFWLARDLQGLLGYAKWQRFEGVIADAKVACERAGGCVEDHFTGAGKMIDLGKGATRRVEDIALTRYACYLIAQNGDPRKPEIAFAMNYFTVQTRKQELVEKRIAEFERVQARNKLSLSQKALSTALFERGIDGAGFGRILSKGDEALFGGANTQAMKDKLGVPDRRPLADFLPTITIKAKDFANEVTHTQVKQHDLRDEPVTTCEHVRNNTDVRRILTERNIHPEALPPGEDVRRVQSRLKSEERSLPRARKRSRRAASARG